MKIFRYILAAFAVFRLSQILPYDKGPWFIFDRIRNYTEAKKFEENEEYGNWSNLHAIVTCTYCQSLYMSIFIWLCLKFKLDFIIVIFGLMGVQTILQDRRFNNK